MTELMTPKAKDVLVYCDAEANFTPGTLSSSLCLPTMRRDLRDLCRRVIELEADLARWPRVFWKSADPRSSAEGFRVLSVEAYDREAVSSGEIIVEDPTAEGGEAGAPIDFGVYPTRERLAEAPDRPEGLQGVLYDIRRVLDSDKPERLMLTELAPAIKKLKETVDRLPKGGDCEPLWPDKNIWSYQGTDPDTIFCAGILSVACADDGSEDYVCIFRDGEGNEGQVDARKCYSTRELAETAAAEGKAKP